MNLNVFCEMKRLFWILFLAAAGCTGIPGTVEGLDYDCIIDEVAYDGELPQEGTVVEIPVKYVYVPTRSEPEVNFQPFRYRAFLDGEEYSYVEPPTSVSYMVLGLLDEETDAFHVVVPENDSYDERTVSIDVSIKSGYGRKAGWGEWKTVFSETQASLKDGQPRRLEGVDGRGIKFVIDDIELSVDLVDNASVRCLKALLVDGELALDVSVANNNIGLSGREIHDYLKERIPLNQTPVHHISPGDIIMTDDCHLDICNETIKNVNQLMTRIGKVSSSSMADLDRICHTEKYMWVDTYPLRLRLSE